jgi:hypothetical protein
MEKRVPGAGDQGSGNLTPETRNPTPETFFLDRIYRMY